MLNIKIYLSFVILFYACLSFAQKKNSFIYGAAINSCLEEVESNDPAITLSDSRALGIFVTAGWQKLIDSNYVIHTSLRYGVERSLFNVKRNGTPLQERYYFSNQSLMLIVAPGLIINNRQRIFVTLGIGRFYQNGGGGGGVRAGRAYTYIQKNELNAFDYRLGLKWQLKLLKDKQTRMELGVETSDIQRQGFIVVNSTYNNRPNSAYKVAYNVLIFYLGLMF